MRCFFIRGGHIAAVELLPDLTDEEAVKQCREMFEARRADKEYDGFEVWNLSRRIAQFPAVGEFSGGPERPAPSGLDSSTPTDARAAGASRES
jgi:hypothetical protein